MARIQTALWLSMMLACVACTREAGDGQRSVQSSLGTPQVALRSVSLPELESAVLQMPRISSFVLYQGGEIVLRQFDSGYGFNQSINIKSASKSVLNALTGIALERGDLKDLDQPISSFLPRYFDNIPDDDPRRRITVRHLLTMSSGLPSTSIYNYGAWVSSRDWIAYALGQEPMYEPGTRMVYSTGDTHLLAAVLTKATGTPLRTYAQRHLFDPLNVEIAAWDRDPQGRYFGGNNFALTPEGLLAFGKLYLNQGILNGRQILASDWIAQSWTPKFRNSSYNGRHDYGYLWWHGEFGDASTWFAWGYGGQFLFLIPSLDAAVVITGDPDAPSRGGNSQVYDLMDEYVVPYLRGRET